MSEHPGEIVIEAEHGTRRYWSDIWKYRELLYFLAWRDILVRYKQTVIGVAWSVLRPTLTMVVFTVVFGRIAKLPSDGVPYPILVFSAMLPWHFFANSVSEGSNSLIQNVNVISKVYFPRLIVPTSTVVVSFVDFLISLVIFSVLMMWYQYLPGIKVLMLPAFLMMAIAVSLGLALFFSAMNVRFRDFRYVVPFVVQLGLFISPVGFSLSVIPEKWRLLYSLNPMVGVIEGFRWSLLPDYRLDMSTLLTSLFVSIMLLAVGIAYFRRTERSFADVI